MVLHCFSTIIFVHDHFENFALYSTIPNIVMGVLNFPVLAYQLQVITEFTMGQQCFST